MTSSSHHQLTCQAAINHQFTVSLKKVSLPENILKLGKVPANSTGNSFPAGEVQELGSTCQDRLCSLAAVK